MTDRIKTLLLFAAFVGTVAAANWAINHYGVWDVGFGLEAPAGVFFAGLAFGLRDALHDRSTLLVIAAIWAGAALSWAIGVDGTIPGGHLPIATASGMAFLLSEASDMAVYTPLRERNWVAGVVASNIVGAIVDSALFLWLAFGSLDYMQGQVVAKTYMVALALPIVWWARSRRREPQGAFVGLP